MTQNLKKFGTNLLSNLVTQQEINDLNHIKSQKNENSLSIYPPSEFDGRIVWDKFISDVQDQSECISCWAFATLFVFSTRLAIYTNGKYKLKFSPAKMIFCKNNDNDKLTSWDDVQKHLSSKASFDFTKNDETKKIQIISPSVHSLLYAWQYLYRYGVCETKCISESYSNNIYSSIQLFGESYDTCPNTKEEMINHRISGYYYVPGTRSRNAKFENGSELNIRKDIYHWGPACSVMKIFYDFLEWDGEGIYVWNKVSPLLNDYGHSVIIVGWGEDPVSKVQYWIVCNTWGTSWGKDKGYFKILRGVNHCEIEENVFNGYPSLPGIRLFLEYPIQYDFEDFIFRNLWGVRDNGYKSTTYEKIMLKRKEIPNFEQTIYLYEKKWWPDFSKLIAGDLKTIVYLINDEKSSESFRMSKRRKRNTGLMNNYDEPNIDCDFFLNVVIIFLLISVFVKYSKKK